MTLIDVIEEVIRRRIQANRLNGIQLSSELYKKLIAEVNKHTGVKLEFDNQFAEFEFSFGDHKVEIRNRAYRDDTNDPDVEEVLIEMMS